MDETKRYSVVTMNVKFKDVKRKNVLFFFNMLWCGLLVLESGVLLFIGPDEMLNILSTLMLITIIILVTEDATLDMVKPFSANTVETVFESEPGCLVVKTTNIFGREYIYEFWKKGIESAKYFEVPGRLMITGDYSYGIYVRDASTEFEPKLMNKYSKNGRVSFRIKNEQVEGLAGFLKSELGDKVIEI